SSRGLRARGVAVPGDQRAARAGAGRLVVALPRRVRSAPAPSLTHAGRPTGCSPLVLPRSFCSASLVLTASARSTVSPRARARAALASPPGPGEAGRFLTAHELDTLRVVTSRFIPGPPDDPDPGALEAGVADAIDMLLGAFTFDPPLIHAGGPFSDRAGATH